MADLLSKLRRNKGTRETASVLLAIVAALATGAWAVFTYLVPPNDRTPKPPAHELDRPSASADDGSVAVGGNVSGSSISVGGNAESVGTSAPKSK
jgi:hypothetical protein